jgi:hypothetical protein
MKAGKLSVPVVKENSFSVKIWVKLYIQASCLFWSDALFAERALALA